MRSTAAKTCSASATSHGSTTARPPECSTSLAAPARPVSPRAISPTVAPRTPKAVATARPIPALAPVTTTFCGLSMSSSFLCLLPFRPAIPRRGDEASCRAPGHRARAACRPPPVARRRPAGARGGRGRRTTRRAAAPVGRRRPVRGGRGDSARTPAGLRRGRAGHSGTTRGNRPRGGRPGTGNPPGETAAAGDVQLQAVDDRDEPGGLPDVAHVLAGGDVAAQPQPELPELVEIVAADRLLEPHHIQLVEDAADAAGLAGAVAAVGVHHEVHVVPGQLTQPAHPLEVALRSLSP